MRWITIAILSIPAALAGGFLYNGKKRNEGLEKAPAGTEERLSTAAPPRMPPSVMADAGDPALTLFLDHRLIRAASEELAQNGVRRERFPGLIRGARRTLCASEELAQNGGRRERFPGLIRGARRTLCARQ
jgi:hypothetical protein